MKQKRLDGRLQKQFGDSLKYFEGASERAAGSVETLLFDRFSRLTRVRRFVLGWVALVVLLISGLVGQNIALSGYYQTLQSVPGGIYKEGVLGEFSNANPIFANSNVDASVSRLLFSGLLKTDGSGALVGDLAQNYEVDTKGLVYTVHLRPGLTWHDGKPLTSADVLYTYQTIQNPDAQSPLESNWKDITVAAPDPKTVTFTLSSPLASFATNLTNGIVPQHVLGSVAAADLRSSDFNTVQPVGSGPFRWSAIQVVDSTSHDAEQQIALLPFDGYIGGKPKLDEFVVHAYESSAHMQQALSDRQLTAAQGFDTAPAQFAKEPGIVKHNYSLRAANMVFFKTSSGILAEKAVRNALVQAADVPTIVSKLGYPARLVREPFLNGQLGYDKAYAQPGFDLAAAQKSLDAAGWKLGSKGMREKDGRPLQFNLSAADTSENKLVTSQLQQQWQALGARLQVQMQPPNDFQNTLTYHNYDALLYSISIGTDPDVFVYWDSAQADVRSTNRLNLSEYKSSAADASLEAGRTRIDPEVRAFKYKQFLQAWQQDAPALGLYQPRMLYLTRGSVDGLREEPITIATDRYNNVQNWQFRQAKVTNK